VAEPPAPPASDQANVALLVLKDKVQRYLGDMVGAVQVTPDGDYTFQLESARVFVKCWIWEGPGAGIVSITAPLLMGCKASPELFEHVALHADDWLFGHLSARRSATDGEVDLFFNHVLLGDYLDPEELKRAAGAVIGTANDLDDQLQAKFGGKRFHEQ
jgi:hypothetical protein